MPPSVLYHCTCITTSTPGSQTVLPPPPHLPSSSYAFHPLHTLYFCEECDVVRCDRCVSTEVSGYYCPNCLFEVPTASVRAEKNRCARNCFQCPHCRNTLSVVPSDPPEIMNTDGSPIAVTGEPPFFLFCNYCRWDSTTVGITFEKPTGLALQLQRLEDSQPETIEFERLKDHFEPLIRASVGGGVTTAAHPSHQRHLSAAQQAASSALSREVPVLRKSTVGHRKTSDPKAAAELEKKAKMNDSEWVYNARLDVASGMGEMLEAELDWLRVLGQKETEGEGFTINDIAEVDKRWNGSWVGSMKSSDLKPLRIPLRSKKSKRCPDCRHILIKPEQKAQSVRFKIKLMAANYLPSIDVRVFLPLPSSAASGAAGTARGRARASTAGTEDSGPAMMQPGRAYPFHLSFTNPLYDPISVRLAIHRPDTGPRPPFAITLPSTPFSISAFAEAWEYGDEDELDDDDLEEIVSGAIGGAGERVSAIGGKRGKSGKGAIGLIERKANVSKIGGEVLISKEATGEVKFNLQVSYTYRGEELAPTEDLKSPSKPDSSKGEMKTFNFFTCVDLGPIAPRDRLKEKRPLE